MLKDSILIAEQVSTAFINSKASRCGKLVSECNIVHKKEIVITSYDALWVKSILTEIANKTELYQNLISVRNFHFF